METLERRRKSRSQDSSRSHAGRRPGRAVRRPRYDYRPETISPRQDVVMAGALVLGFLLLYLRTLCPTVYLGDGGELMAAIATGGVAHPPGYPLFTLLGRVALWLVPFGEPAFRIGCLVALAAAGAVGTLYGLARALRCTPWAAAAGAAAFGACSLFWSHSTRVEVYSLHVLLVGLALLGAVRYRQSGRAPALALALLAFSLGLAHHLTMAHLTPVLLLLCGRRLWLHLRRDRRVMALAAMLLIGPALYGLLMVWARSGSGQIWGLPVTPERLWTHATAQYYWPFLGLPNGVELQNRLARAWQLYHESFPWVLCALPLFGLAVLAVRDRAVAGAFLVLVLAAVGFNVCYRIDDISPFYLPVWAVAAVLLAVTVDGAARLLEQRRQRLAACGAVFCLVAAGLPARNWSACDMSGQTWIRDFARTTLANVEQNGVLLTNGDTNQFALWYQQDVLGFRRDVVLLDLSLLEQAWERHDRDPSKWYLQRLQRHGVPVQIPQDAPATPSERLKVARGVAIELLEGPLYDRPVFVWLADIHSPLSMHPHPVMQWAGEAFRPVPHGIITRLEAKELPADPAALLSTNRRLWEKIALPEIPWTARNKEPAADAVITHYGVMLVNYGLVHEQNRDLRRAEEIYRRTVTWAPRFRAARLALSAVQQKREKEALGLL